MIGVLVVSHSAQAAAGIAEIASQMSGGACVKGVGGNDSGGIGSSVPMVFEALSEMLSLCDSVVMIPDLGSSVLSSRAVLEMLDEADFKRVRVADAPVLEGSVVAAIEAGAGSSMEDVLNSAKEARNMEKLQD